MAESDNGNAACGFGLPLGIAEIQCGARLRKKGTVIPRPRSGAARLDLFDGFMCSLRASHAWESTALPSTDTSIPTMSCVVNPSGRNKISRFIDRTHLTLPEFGSVYIPS
jgi:hypothetical protein